MYTNLFHITAVNKVAKEGKIDELQRDLQTALSEQQFFKDSIVEQQNEINELKQKIKEDKNAYETKEEELLNALDGVVSKYQILEKTMSNQQENMRSNLVEQKSPNSQHSKSFDMNKRRILKIK